MRVPGGGNHRFTMGVNLWFTQYRAFTTFSLFS